MTTRERVAELLESGKIDFSKSSNDVAKELLLYLDPILLLEDKCWFEDDPEMMEYLSNRRKQLWQKEQ